MFILRKITGTGIEMNFDLGSSYTVTRKDWNPEEFTRSVSLLGDNEEVKEHDLYGYVADEHGHAHRLYPKQTTYVMTSDGKTFSNLSLK